MPRPAGAPSGLSRGVALVLGGGVPGFPGGGP